MDACAPVVSELEERPEIVRYAREDEALGLQIGRSIGLPLHLLLHGPEHELRLERMAANQRRPAGGSGAVAQHRSRHVGSMSRVHIGGPVVGARIEDDRAPVRSDRVALDRDDAAREIRVDRRRGARIEARVADGDDPAPDSPRPLADNAEYVLFMMVVETLLAGRASTRSRINRTPWTADRSLSCLRRCAVAAPVCTFRTRGFASNDRTLNPSERASRAILGMSLESKTSTR
jgi:hypothetical protein